MIKFQYNKTSLQQLEKQLKVRVRTLPIIKNKESALRMEVKRCKTDARALAERFWLRGWNGTYRPTRRCSPFGTSSTAR